MPVIAGQEPVPVGLHLPVVQGAAVQVLLQVDRRRHGVCADDIAADVLDRGLDGGQGQGRGRRDWRNWRSGSHCGGGGGGRGVSVPAAVGDAGRVAGGGQAAAAEPVEEVLGIIIFQSKLQNVPTLNEQKVREERKTERGDRVKARKRICVEGQ